MRKLLLSISIALIALPLHAALRSESQAAMMANEFFSSRPMVQQGARAPQPTPSARLVRTIDFAQKAQPAVYVYQQANSEAYVFIAASDKVDRILGYTDEPIHNSPSDAQSTIPPALEFWLQAYADEIALLEQGQGEVHELTARAAIATLLKDENGNLIQWNQSDPFNRYCPYLDGKICATGCVATAISQIMRYYRYPERPTGQKSYTWEKGDQTLSIDYDTVPAYDWASMKSKKTSYSTNAQRKAVSQLMRDVGYSVEMNYGPSSGATTSKCLTALPTYFGYSTDIFMVGALSLPTQEYEDLVYSSLEKKHPVLLTGTKIAGGAHAFVCDGADDKGFFHINWGWGGSYDGYFDLSILDSKGTGIGGSSAQGGYCAHRNAVFNILPPTIHDIVTKPANLHPLAADSITINTSILQKGETLTVYVGKIVNTQGEPWTGYYGVLLSGDNMSSRYWMGGQSSTSNFKPGYLLSKTADITYASLVKYCTKPGVYYLKPSYKAKTDGAIATTMPVAFGPNKVKLTLDNKGVFSVELESDTTQPTPPEPSFEVALIDLENDSAACLWEGPETMAYCEYTVTAADQSISIEGSSTSLEGDVCFRYYTNSTITISVTAYTEEGEVIGTDSDQITPAVKTDFTATNASYKVGTDSIRFSWSGAAPVYQVILYEGTKTLSSAVLFEPKEDESFTCSVVMLEPGSYKLGIRPVSPTKKAYLGNEKKFTFTITDPTTLWEGTEMPIKKDIKVIENGQIYFLKNGKKYTIFGQPTH